MEFRAVIMENGCVSDIIERKAANNQSMLKIVKRIITENHRFTKPLLRIMLFEMHDGNIVEPEIFNKNWQVK